MVLLLFWVFFVEETVNSFEALLVFIVLPYHLQASQLKEEDMLFVSRGEALVTFWPSMYPSGVLHSGCPVLKSFQDRRAFSAFIFLSLVAFLTTTIFDLMFS